MNSTVDTLFESVLSFSAGRPHLITKFPDQDSMADTAASQQLRLRIGNISSSLSEKPDLLEARIAKFGSVVGNLELHTKPTGDYYFAFITVDFPENGFKKLKTSLGSAMFMGRKLAVDIAKPDFRQRWEKDSKRADEKKEARQRQFQIQLARNERIKESKTPHYVNSLDNSIVGKPLRTSYMKSSHTFNNISGNTKHQPPTQTLHGDKSYGALTKEKKIVGLLLSRTSGGGELCSGRHRKTPRSKLAQRQQTLRILTNGKAVQIKAYKTKLWGYEKNKTVNDLTWNYSDGIWTSGYNHVLERTNLAVADKNFSKEILEDEMDRNNSVLASFLTGYDFEKPAEVLEDNDEANINGIAKEDILTDAKGRRKVVHYDYEMEGTQADHEMENNAPVSAEARQAIEAFKSNAQRPLEEQYFSEGDESELDIEQLKLNSKSLDAEDVEYVEDDVNEVEPQDHNPPSSKPTTLPQPQLIELTAEKKPETEALRSLLNPEEEGTGFKLALSDEEDEIDETNVLDTKEQTELLEQIRQKQQQLQKNAIPALVATRGLFWPHFDSPFLHSQSQLSKVGALIESVKLLGEDEPNLEGRDGETPFEKWFWSKRGEIARECKRRKRDVARAFKKSSLKRPME